MVIIGIDPHKLAHGHGCRSRDEPAGGVGAGRGDAERLSGSAAVE